MCLRTKTTQVKRYSSIAPFVPQKHICKGKTSRHAAVSTYWSATVSVAAVYARADGKILPEGWRFFQAACFTLADMFLWNKGSD